MNPKVLTGLTIALIIAWALLFVLPLIATFMINPSFFVVPFCSFTGLVCTTIEYYFIKKRNKI